MIVNKEKNTKRLFFVHHDKISEIIYTDDLCYSCPQIDRSKLLSCVVFDKPLKYKSPIKDKQIGKLPSYLYHTYPKRCDECIDLTENS